MRTLVHFFRNAAFFSRMARAVSVSSALSYAKRLSARGFCAIRSASDRRAKSSSSVGGGGGGGGCCWGGGGGGGGGVATCTGGCGGGGGGATAGGCFLLQADIVAS